MNERAFALAVEALLAMLFVAAIASFPQQNEKAALHELLLLQKENDLLKIWLQCERLDESEMASDFTLVFPESAGAIEFRGKKIEIKKQGAAAKRAVSSSALFLDEARELVELRVAVYE